MSSPSQNHHNYLSRVANAASTPKLEAILKTSSKLGANTTRTCLVIEDGSSARTQTLNTPAEVFNAAAENLSYSRKIVCIVENISSEYIGSLGFAWDIDPGFFVQHAENPRREDLWVPKEFELDGSRANFSCIDGNFEYHGLEVNNDKELNFRPNRFERYCYKTTWEGVETIASNTRISYCRVMELFCRDFRDFFVIILLTGRRQIFSWSTRRWIYKSDTAACLVILGPRFDCRMPKIVVDFSCNHSLSFVIRKKCITVFSSL